MEVLENGVPQESIEGPILFIIYLNDLEDNVKGGSYMTNCADDSNILVYAQTWPALIANANSTLRKEMNES